ncbi:MAG: EamA family transporter [Flavobacteriaceae bacterium]|nr:EamA family transporter [Flavobacteriaceae bacterium]
MKTYKYYFAAFNAFLIWGFFSLALKPLKDFSSLDILFYRVFLSSIVMLLINLIFRRNIVKKNALLFSNLKLEDKRRIVLLTLGGSFLLIANWFVFIYVVNHINVKAASLAYLICPILTTVFAFVILKEKLSKPQWIAVFISICSCFLLSLNHFQDIFFSLIVAASYALYLVSQRKNSEIDKFITLTIQLVFTALVILPFYPSYSNVIPTVPIFYICLVVIVLVFTIVPLFLNLYALKGLNSSTVGIIMYINPIINFLIAVFYYKEEVTITQLISYFLILISIIVFNEKLLFNRKYEVFLFKNNN